MKMSSALVLLIALISGSLATASKARLSALGNSLHLSDAQTLYYNPADIHRLSDFASFEFGNNNIQGYNLAIVDQGSNGADGVSATQNSPYAEALFIKSTGDVRWGLGLGHLSEDTFGFRQGASATVAAGLYNAVGDSVGYATADALKGAFNGFRLLGQENPLILFYGKKTGDLGWAASLVYSGSDKKNGLPSVDNGNFDGVYGATKQTAYGVLFGVNHADYRAYANIGLASTVDTSYAVTGVISEKKIKYQGTGSWKFGGDYQLAEKRLLVAEYINGGAKMEIDGSESFNWQKETIRLGLVEFLDEEKEIFLSASLLQDVLDRKKPTGVKTTVLSLPVILGFESAVASFLTLRGSVSSPVILGTTKSTGSPQDTLSHQTMVAMGAGLNFNKSILDFSLNMASSGNFQFDDLGAKAAYTYQF